MFDIGFWELLIVAIVALFVVGPERVPGLIRSTGQWVGRIRAFTQSVRQELDQEISKVEEMKRLTQEQMEIFNRNALAENDKPTVPTAAGRSAPVVPNSAVSDEPSGPQPADVASDASPKPATTKTD